MITFNEALSQNIQVWKRNIFFLAAALLTTVVAFSYVTFEKNKELRLLQLVKDQYDRYEETGDSFRITSGIRSLLKNTELAEAKISTFSGSMLFHDKRETRTFLHNPLCAEANISPSSSRTETISICIVTEYDQNLFLILAITIVGLFLIFWLQMSHQFSRRMQLHNSYANIRNLLVSGQMDKVEPPLTVEEHLLSEEIRKFKRAQADYDRISNLSDRDRALRELSEQVSHDIRSPLGALKQVKSGIIASLSVPDEAKELLSRSIDRIQELVNDLNSDPSKKAPQCTDISSLAETVIAEKRAQFRASEQASSPKITLFTEGSITASCHPDFPRVLSNLLDNAIQAQPDTTIEVACRSTEDLVFVTVSDSSGGFSEELKEKVGRRGFSTKAGGTGLGLFHAFKTVEAAGGSIDIQSTVGVGTIVQVKLLRA